MEELGTKSYQDGTKSRNAPHFSIIKIQNEWQNIFVIYVGMFEKIIWILMQ